MSDEATPLGDLSDTTGAGRNEKVRSWLDDNDEYRSSDVDYAISVLELGSDTDRDGIASTLAIAALVIAVASTGLLDKLLIGQIAAAGTAIFALIVALIIQSRHLDRRVILTRLYDLRDRAPRRREGAWWPRQGQVYLAPKGVTRS